MKKILPFLLLVTSACSPFAYRNLATTPELVKEMVPPEEEEALDEILSLVAKGYAAQKPGPIVPMEESFTTKSTAASKQNFR
jgi:hypothetical protein